MSDLTHVELLWLEKRIENRIRFGRAAEEQILDQRRRILSFAPGSIFAFVRWASNDFGTVISRSISCGLSRRASAARPCLMYDQAAKSCCACQAGRRSNACCRLIDAVEALGIDPADAAPDYWHHVHNRLSVNEMPRAYTRSRHQAWLHRRRIAP